MYFFSLFSPKAHFLDRPKHYLRLKFLIDNQVQFYVPKPEEELWDLVSCSYSNKHGLNIGAILIESLVSLIDEHIHANNSMIF